MDDSSTTTHLGTNPSSRAPSPFMHSWASVNPQTYPHPIPNFCMAPITSLPPPTTVDIMKIDDYEENDPWGLDGSNTSPEVITAEAVNSQITQTQQQPALEPEPERTHFSKELALDSNLLETIVRAALLSRALFKSRAKHQKLISILTIFKSRTASSLNTDHSQIYENLLKKAVKEVEASESQLNVTLKFIDEDVRLKIEEMSLKHHNFLKSPEPVTWNPKPILTSSQTQSRPTCNSRLEIHPDRTKIMESSALDVESAGDAWGSVPTTMESRPPPQTNTDRGQDSGWGSVSICPPPLTTATDTVQDSGWGSTPTVPTQTRTENSGWGSVTGGGAQSSGWGTGSNDDAQASGRGATDGSGPGQSFGRQDRGFRGRGRGRGRGFGFGHDGSNEGNQDSFGGGRRGSFGDRGSSRGGSSNWGKGRGGDDFGSGGNSSGGWAADNNEGARGGNSSGGWGADKNDGGSGGRGWGANKNDGGSGGDSSGGWGANTTGGSSGGWGANKNDGGTGGDSSGGWGANKNDGASGGNTSGGWGASTTVGSSGGWGANENDGASGGNSARGWGADKSDGASFRSGADGWNSNQSGDRGHRGFGGGGRGRGRGRGRGNEGGSGDLNQPNCGGFGGGRGSGWAENIVDSQKASSVDNGSSSWGLSTTGASNPSGVDVESGGGNNGYKDCDQPDKDTTPIVVDPNRTTAEAFDWAESS